MQYNGKISFDAKDSAAMPLEDFLTLHKGKLMCAPEYEVEELTAIHAACCKEVGVEPVEKKMSKKKAEA